MSAARLPLALSALLMGACMPTLAGLAGGRLAEIADAPAQRRWWPATVLVFSLGQAGGGYLLTWVAARAGGYAPTFALASTASLLGILALLHSRRQARAAAILR